MSGKCITFPLGSRYKPIRVNHEILAVGVNTFYFGASGRPGSHTSNAWVISDLMAIYLAPFATATGDYIRTHYQFNSTPEERLMSNRSMFSHYMLSSSLGFPIVGCSSLNFIESGVSPALTGRNRAIYLPWPCELAVEVNIVDPTLVGRTLFLRALVLEVEADVDVTQWF